VDVHFGRLKKRVFQEKQISLDLMDDARQWMSEKGYDIRHGARDLVRLIEREIEQPLAVKLLWEQVVPGQALPVQLDSENDKLIITPGNNTTQD
jgi:ATP-dependent Clp protease ATP-binding subunit ClpA